MQSSATEKRSRDDQVPARKQKTKTMLNVPLLAGTLVAVALLCPSAYFWHRYQVSRTADAFLRRADGLEKEEKWNDAAAYLFRYLRLRPNDADVRIRLAEVFDKSAKDWSGRNRAVELYYQALGAASPEKSTALRRRVAELYLELAAEPGAPQQPILLAQAESEARTLLQSSDKDASAERLLALARYAQFQAGAPLSKAETDVPVGEELEKALRLNPNDVQLAAIMARVYRDYVELLSQEQLQCDQKRPDGKVEKRELTEKERQAKADQLIDQMVEANRDRPEAPIERYRYRVQYGLSGPEDDLQAALELAPNNVEIRLLAASYEVFQGRRAQAQGGSADQARSHYDSAQKHYEHIINKVSPTEERAYLGLAEVYQALRDMDRAVQTYRRGLERCGGDSIRLNLYLTNALISQQHFDEAKEPLDALEQAIHARAATLPRSVWLDLNRSADFLRARWLIGTRDYARAIPLLKKIMAGQQSTASEVAQCYAAGMLLGKVYFAMNQWDDAAAAFEQIATLQPETVRPRLYAAAAWTYADRPELAIDFYRSALSRDAASRTITDTQRAEAWLRLAQAEFRRQVRLPESERDWKPFQEALDAAKSSIPEESLGSPWRTALLEADYLVVRGEEQGQRDQGIRGATELLRKTERRYPKSEDFLRRLVLAYERLASPADADRALKQFDALAGESATALLLQARLYSLRQQYQQARAVLREGLKTVPENVRPVLERELAQVDLWEGNTERSRKQLLELHKEYPSNTGLIRQLLDLAFDERKQDEVRRWEEELRQSEGPNGLYFRYARARRLLGWAKSPEDRDFLDGVEILAQLKREHPAWPAVQYLTGVAAEAQGRFDEAIQAYRAAIRVGRHDLSVYERLILLLRQTRQFDEANKYLARARGRGLSSRNLQLLEIDVAAGGGDLASATSLAEKAVSDHPNDPVAEVKRGQLLAADNQTRAAEEAFVQAVQKAPTDLRTYSALFNFYVRTEKPDLAKKTLAELAENVDLSAAEMAGVLAQGYESVQEIDKAEAGFQKARRLAPENAGIALRFADFLLRQSKPAEAETVLRDVLVRAPHSVGARRALAGILVQRGGEKEFEEACRLLEQSQSSQAVLNLDRRLKALVLARRGGKENRAEAQQILEDLIATPGKSTDGDRLQLAWLYERQAMIPAARRQFLALVQRSHPDPTHVAAYVDLLLRHNLPDDATAWLDKLQELAPDNLGTLDLRARWLHAQGRVPQIKPLVDDCTATLLKKVGTDDRKKAQLFLTIGNIYSEVDIHTEAQHYYELVRKLVPERYEPLALCLARQNRAADAIAVCTESAESDASARPAMVLAAILTSVHPGAEDFHLADPLLAEALDREPENVGLLVSVANVRIVEQRVDDAVALYRRVLKLRPNYLMVLNNLATVLSEQPGKTDEALKYVDQAIDIAGKQGTLLDTKGTILVYAGKPKEAVPLLEEAASSPEADPRCHFHLAVAYHRSGRQDKAHEELQKARDADLENQILTQADRKLLAELERTLR